MYLKNNEWSIMGVWNDQLTLGQKGRKMRPRERIWASEIGKGFYERYLKMTGVEPDIKFDERTLRKFAAGLFFERIIGFVLICSGLLKEDNKWYNVPEDKDHLEVSVKPDFIAGGKPNWEQVQIDIESNPFFEIMPLLKHIAKALVEKLAAQHPTGMRDLVYEIKTVNSQVFWAKKDNLAEAYPHHVMQLYTGMKATNLPEGRLLYISKDDLTTSEFRFRLDDMKLHNIWEKDVRQMTEYIRSKTKPPVPENIVFNPNKKLSFQYKKIKYGIPGVYVDNWEVGWSNYLPMMTGFKTLKGWKNSIKPKMKELNDKLKEDYKLALDKTNDKTEDTKVEF